MVMLVWKEQTWKGSTEDTVMTSYMMKEELFYSVYRCTISQFAIHSSKRKTSIYDNIPQWDTTVNN